MILDTIFGGIASVLTALLGLIPDIPPMPEAVGNSAEYVLDISATGAGVAFSLFGSVMYYFVFTVAIALVVFEPAYHAFLWLLRKLPISSS